MIAGGRSRPHRRSPDMRTFQAHELLCDAGYTEFGLEPALFGDVSAVTRAVSS